ncbi:MAG: hypothetical protein ACOYMF_05285 [Bacteroidales bacterium]
MENASTILLDFYRFLTPITLAFIGFWLVRFVNKVDALEKVMTAMQLNYSASDSACRIKHTNIENTLKTHELDIKELYSYRNRHAEEIEHINTIINKS